MAEVTGTEKVAQAAAAFMDVLDAYLNEADCAEVVEVMVVAEVRYDEDDQRFDEVVLKATTDSCVHQRGLAQAAMETVQGGGAISVEADEE